MAATVFCNIISLGLPWPQAFPSRLTWNIHGNWWQIPDIFPSFRHLKLTSFLWPLIPSFPLQISRKTCRTHRPLFPQMSPASFSAIVTDLFCHKCHRPYCHGCHHTPCHKCYQPLFPRMSPTSFLRKYYQHICSNCHRIHLGSTFSLSFLTNRLDFLSIL